MTTRHAEHVRPAPPYGRAALILGIAAGAALQTGCGREFFREWANQDVSEAVFEKTRDPRWSMEMFSHVPPAMSRFADPTDPDNPPAPPDDFAAQAMSPVPQNPNNRFLVPLEGTGYLKMLDQWQRERPMVDPGEGDPLPATSEPAGMGRPPGIDDATTIVEPPKVPSPFGRDAQIPPPPPTPSPAPPAANPPTGRTPPNSGPGIPNLTPSNGASRPAPTRDQEIAAAIKAYHDRTQSRIHDSGVLRTSAQDPAGARPPMNLAVPPSPTPPPSRNATQAPPSTGRTTNAAPVQTPATPPTGGRTDPPPPPPVPPAAGDAVDRPAERTTQERLRTPRTPQDPDPVDQDLSRPVITRPGEDPNQRAAAEELGALLGPRRVPFYESDAAGLPRDSRPYVINMEQAFTLALINSRSYQTRLENLYYAALPVTLNRFTFTPQFLAALGSGTPPAGLAPASSPGNSFLYRTRETGNQVSTLNLGTVAGVGKLFDNGGRILVSFANQIVFNFVGARPMQPTVQSVLPIQIVQPFLKGAGRAVTLEALTDAERNLLYEARAFARFRQEFTVQVLTGGTGATALAAGAAAAGISGGGGDVTIGFLTVVRDLQRVENDVKNVAAYDNLFKVYEQLIDGESSGLTQLQVDQIDQNRQNARTQLLQDQLAFRNSIDQYKMQLGLPPDVPIVVDRGATRPFQEVFQQIDDWARKPKRELSELDAIAARLPDLEDVYIDGRSCLGTARAVSKDDKITDNNLEELLLAGERVALENRLDLMNARAQLYDSWREIRIAANALKGVFNVSITNQILTPPNTTNPFALVDQAKTVSVVLNAELPLVRMAERNNFVGTLINYQRQRRSLMQAEDQLKYSIRLNIRNLQQQYRTYEIARRNFVLTVRQKDQSFENIIAPPAGTAGNTQAATQTINLINAQNGLIGQQNQLIGNWLTYQQVRLQLFRDLGVMPFDEWEAFYEFFPAARANTGGALGSPTDVPAGRPDGGAGN